MLFDLRGRGRRRTVQVVYLVLAVLMGGSLILLNTNGLSFGGGGGGSADTGIFGDRRKAAEAKVKANRQDASAWAALAVARYQEASAGDGFDQNAGSFTEPGKANLREADRAWKQYLKLDPPKPDANVASQMTQAYGPAGLNKPDDAVVAQEVVADARDDLGSYLNLATLAYAAGQSRKADLAGQKAIDLATKDQKEQIKAQVDSLKQQAAQAAVQQAQDAAPQTGTTAP